MNEHVSELSRAELLQRYAKQSKPAAASQRRSPFKFLDSYDVDDADIFFGRDAEIEELLGRFHSSGHVLIYGESGSGKSSLIQCGLRSRIPAADALFIPLRVHTTGLPTVGLQIRTHAFQALDEFVEVPDDAGLVETLRAVRESASRPLVLFFDQFEELFIFHDSETRSRFAEELAAIPKSKLNVKVIIGVRQDYLAHLSELEETVEGLFDNRFWLRRMSRENAAEGVVKACATCDVKVDDDLAESILHRLDPGGQGVELPYLQVVMDRLYRQAVDANPAQPVISAADVEKLGDIANILGSFLVEEVEKLPSPDIGRQILKAFVTREGTRRTLDREAVAREAAGFGAAVSDPDLETHLAQLASVRILREIADSGTYELRHDALAATVSGWISEVEKELIEVRDNLVNRFTEYEARGRERTALLDEAFLDYLGVYQKRLTPLLNDAQREYLETSRREVQRRKRVRQLSIGGGVLAVVLVAFLLLWKEAARQKDLVKAEREKFDQARSAVDKFFVTVSEETLLNQPGLQDLRTTLLGEAREFYDYFLEEASKDEHPDDQLRGDLARTHYYLGEITRETVDDKASMTYFQKARDMQLDLKSRNPKDRDLLFDLGNTLNALGRAHDNLGERDEALLAYEKAQKVRQELADSHSDDSEYQRKLANTIMNIGLVNRKIGLEEKVLADCEEAKQQINRAQQIRREQVEKLEQALNDGGGVEINAALFKMSRDLAKGFFNLGTFEEAMLEKKLLTDEDEAFATAEKFYNQAIDSLKPWSDSNDMETDFLLGEYYRKLGNAVADLKQGESHFHQAKRRLEKLAIFNPEVKDYQSAFARLRRNLGELYLDLAYYAEPAQTKEEYHEKAREEFKAALELLEPWKDDDPLIRQDWENIDKRLKELGQSQPAPMQRLPACDKSLCFQALCAHSETSAPPETDFLATPCLSIKLFFVRVRFVTWGTPSTAIHSGTDLIGNGMTIPFNVHGLKCRLVVAATLLVLAVARPGTAQMIYGEGINPRPYRWQGNPSFSSSIPPQPRQMPYGQGVYFPANGWQGYPPLNSAIPPQPRQKPYGQGVYFRSNGWQAYPPLYSAIPPQPRLTTYGQGVALPTYEWQAYPPLNSAAPPQPTQMTYGQGYYLRAPAWQSGSPFRPANLLLLDDEAPPGSAATSPADSADTTSPNTPRRRRTRVEDADGNEQQGDSFTSSTYTFWNADLYIDGVVDFPVPGRTKITENNSAMPEDRVYFVYKHFHNTLNTTINDTTGTTLVARDISTNRYVMGFEKTFLNEMWSVDLRVPLTSTLVDAYSPGLSSDLGGIGNFSVTVKQLMYESDTLAVAAGLGISLPTGEDARITLGNEVFTLRNEAAHLLPFAMFVSAPTERTFYRGYLQLDIPAVENPIDLRDASVGATASDLGTVRDHTLLYAGLSAGVWLYQNPQSRGLTGLASAVDLHYTETVRDARNKFGNTANTQFGFGTNAISVLNLSFGVYSHFGNRTTTYVGAVVPLHMGANRFFDAEVQCSVNYAF